MKLEHLNQRQFSEVSGLSTRQIRNLESEGLPFSSAGREKRYPMPSAIQWLLERRALQAIDQQGNGDLKEERTRWTRERADAQEMENAVRRRELIHIDDMAELLRRSLERVDRGLKDAPRVHAAKLAKEAGVKTPTARDMLAGMIEAIRRDLRSTADGISKGKA
ncbi:hypothetical protein ACGF5M_00785 [Gemmatimonadota bacterium]